jgi:uncharacterized protein involved in type VI secretion and phage assembly
MESEDPMKELGGIFMAIVIDNVDPENSGRVKVRLPQLGGADDRGREAWARIATLTAGAHRGSWFIPELNDEVVVAFEQGDLRRPCVLGSLWSSAHPPPEPPDARNDRKLLRSRSGVTITLDDQRGQESVTIETPGGRKLTLKDGPGSIELTDGNGNSLELDASGITVHSSSKVTLNASAVDINAGMVRVNAGTSQFSGIVQCDTLIANSVVSASYTPGAGNVW